MYGNCWQATDRDERTVEELRADVVGYAEGLRDGCRGMVRTCPQLAAFIDDVATDLQRLADGTFDEFRYSPR